MHKPSSCPIKSIFIILMPMAPYQSHYLVRNMIWQEEMAVMVLISIYTNRTIYAKVVVCIRIERLFQKKKACSHLPLVMQSAIRIDDMELIILDWSIKKHYNIRSTYSFCAVLLQCNVVQSSQRSPIAQFLSSTF